MIRHQLYSPTQNDLANILKVLFMNVIHIYGLDWFCPLYTWVPFSTPAGNTQHTHFYALKVFIVDSS